MTNEEIQKFLEMRFNLEMSISLGEFKKEDLEKHIEIKEYLHTCNLLKEKKEKLEDLNSICPHVIYMNDENYYKGKCIICDTMQEYYEYPHILIHPLDNIEFRMNGLDEIARVVFISLIMRGFSHEKARIHTQDIIQESINEMNLVDYKQENKSSVLKLVCKKLSSPQYETFSI